MMYQLVTHFQILTRRNYTQYMYMAMGDTHISSYSYVSDSEPVKVKKSIEEFPNADSGTEARGF